MRHRIASLSWTAGLAVAVAATSFMVSAPADARAEKCKTERRVSYVRVCKEGTHVAAKSWHTPGKTWIEGYLTSPRCWLQRVTRSVRICPPPGGGAPRPPTVGRPTN